MSVGRSRLLSAVARPSAGSPEGSLGVAIYPLWPSVWFWVFVTLALSVCHPSWSCSVSEVRDSLHSGLHWLIFVMGGRQVIHVCFGMYSSQSIHFWLNPLTLCSPFIHSPLHSCIHCINHFISLPHPPSGPCFVAAPPSFDILLHLGHLHLPPRNILTPVGAWLPRVVATVL